MVDDYIIAIHYDKETNTYTSAILEFRGCISQGDTIEEAVSNIKEAAKLWVEASLYLKQEILEPKNISAYWNFNEQI